MLRFLALILVAWMGISITLALLIGRAIRSMPNVPFGARPPLPLPRPQVLLPLAVAGTLAAMAVFALAAQTLDPGATRSDVADGALLPGSLPRPSPAADGARDRPKSAPRSASPTFAVAAVALRTPSQGVGAPTGSAPSSGRPAPGPSGRKGGGGSNASISLPADGQSPAPTSPPVSEPNPPAPAAPPSPEVDQADQADAGWPGGDLARRPSGGSENASAPSVPARPGEVGNNDQGGGGGDE